MVPVPKKFKYRSEIFDAIVYSIFNNQEERASYNRLHRQVSDKLNTHISKRDFQSHLTKLVDDGMISKETLKGDIKKTLPLSFYSLTTRGKKIDSLKLTGADYEDNRSKKKKLYMLLLCFEYFKRGSVLSKRQLSNLLKQYETSFDKLEIIDNKKINQESIPEISMFTQNLTFYKTYNNIIFMKFKNVNDKKYYYYMIIPGFSAQEFKFYIELIRRGIEPHPFSEYRTSMEIPTISYLNFSMMEIKDAINLLKDNDIIKPINSIITGELRYEIKDDYLEQIFGCLWLLHIIDFHMVMNRLIYCDKPPLENDSKFLKFYHGQKKASNMLAYLHDYKKKYKKDLTDENSNSEYSKEIEEQRKEFANEIELLYKKITTKNENYFIVSLMKDICLPIDGVT